MKNHRFVNPVAGKALFQAQIMITCYSAYVETLDG